MTLPQARVILENYLTQIETCEPSLHVPEGLEEALENAISLLPEPERRETADGALAGILERLREAEGLDPFATRSRDRSLVAWREAVWLELVTRGYMKAEIGRATGYHHSSVHFGVNSLKDLIRQGDRLATGVWARLIEILKA